ncbi:MAG: hypothetical protein GY772_05265 [bacterium]|nr:hypothetical protein [bacterium]
MSRLRRPGLDGLGDGGGCGRGPDRGTVMRHLRGTALEVPLLARGMVGPPPLCALVAASSADSAVPASGGGAGPAAVAIPPVAAATQANLSMASSTLEEAVRDEVGVDRAASTGETDRDSAVLVRGPTRVRSCNLRALTIFWARSVAASVAL